MTMNHTLMGGLKAPFTGEVVRIPVVHLAEGKNGVKIQQITTGYDIMFKDDSVRTISPHRLRLASPIEILLFF